MKPCETVVTVNPPDSAPEDKAVELAKMVVEQQDSLWAASDTYDLAQAVLGKQERDKLFKDARDTYFMESKRAKAKVTALRAALAFAQSVIKCGEPWTDQCEEIIGGALSATPPAAPDATKERDEVQS